MIDLQYHHRMRISRTALTLLSMLLMAPALALDISDRTLRYSVTYTSQDAGELEVIIARSGDEVKTTAISHLSNLAKMFLSGLTAENFFSIQEGGIRLERGHLLSHDHSEVKTSYNIDRKQGQLVFVPERDASGIAPDDVFDSTTFPLVLVSSDISTIEGTKIREISTKRVSTYVYLAPEQEKLEIDGRTYDTWKVIRQKPGDPERNVTIWLDRNNDQVPLRIVSVKNRKATEFTLLPDS